MYTLERNIENSLVLDLLDPKSCSFSNCIAIILYSEFLHTLFQHYISTSMPISVSKIVISDGVWSIPTWLV